MGNWWTDKRGYVGNVPSDSNNLSFQLNQQKEFGGLSVAKKVSRQPDGSVAIIKGHGMFSKIIHAPTVETISVVSKKISGNVWVVGKNLYGCLGTGEDYGLVTTGEGEYDWWDNPDFSIDMNSVWRTGGDYFSCSATATYLGISGEYECRQYTLPGWSGGWGEPVWIAQVWWVTTLNVHHTQQRSSETIATWPTVKIYKNIGIENIVWASIGYDSAGANSFLIDIKGNMYCCGSNSWGQLGTGDPYGLDHLVSTVPMVYWHRTSFVQVPGVWKSVHAGGHGPTWAIKADGTWWAAGYNGGGVPGILGTDPINTFTKVNDVIYAGMCGAYPYKKVGDPETHVYETYYYAGTDLLVNETIDIDSYQGAFPGLTIEIYCAMMEASGAVSTFIADDGKHPFEILLGQNKPKGTLWSYPYTGSELIHQEVPGTDWIFTAGAPRRVVPGGSIDGGANIAIRSS